MEIIKNIIKLCRPQQWYKNLLVFIAIFFSGNLFNSQDLIYSIYGFVSLCLISSSYYVINDIIDAKLDRKHPEKKNRPIAAGKIKIWQAIILTILLVVASISIANYLSRYFTYCIVFLFVFTQIYSFWLKNEVFADVIAIAINFVVKAISGAFIINVEISSWLIICAFFLALFLVYGKRRADIQFLKKKQYEYKQVLKKYTVEILDPVVHISAAILVVSYALYCLLSGSKGIIITLPVVVYTVFRYMQFIHSGSIIARRPENVFKDKRMMVGMILWGVIAFFSVYGI